VSKVRPGVGRILGILATLFFVVLFIAIPDPREFARAHGAVQRLSIATGGTGGVWYPYGGGVAKVISDRVQNIEATAEVTSASVDNLKLLRNGRADLAFSITDVLADAYRGEGAFRDFGRVPVRTLAVLYPQPTQLVTFATKPIERLADLRGRVVSIGSPGSGTEILARRILEAAGIDPDRDIRPQGLSVAESVGALRDGKIDAFFWNSGLPAGSVLDLANTPGRRIRLLPHDEVLPELRRRYGDSIYYRALIPAATYPGMTGDVPVVALSSALVVDEAMAEELVYEITRALFEHRDDLAAIHPAALELTPGSAVAGSPVPFHPGAIRYYRERGAWPD
jgi:uncharacterized protein